MRFHACVHPQVCIMYIIHKGKPYIFVSASWVIGGARPPIKEQSYVLIERKKGSQWLISKTQEISDKKKDKNYICSLEDCYFLQWTQVESDSYPFITYQVIAVNISNIKNSWLKIEEKRKIVTERVLHYKGSFVSVLNEMWIF